MDALMLVYLVHKNVKGISIGQHVKDMYNTHIEFLNSDI